MNILYNNITENAIVIGKFSFLFKNFNLFLWLRFYYIPNMDNYIREFVPKLEKYNLINLYKNKESSYQSKK